MCVVQSFFLTDTVVLVPVGLGLTLIISEHTIVIGFTRVTQVLQQQQQQQQQQLQQQQPQQQQPLLAFQAADFSTLEVGLIIALIHSRSAILHGANGAKSLVCCELT
jgi:heme exporter protein D